MPTLFTRIIDGELPGTFVWSDDRCVAFLTIEPLTPGHTLVVPRTEVDHWLDCPPDLRDHLMAVAAIVGRAQRSVWSPAKVGVIIAGLEVPHLHIHVLPIESEADLDFSRASPATSEAMGDAAGRILAAMSEAGESPGV